MPTGVQATSVLKDASLESQGISSAGLDRLYARIENHIADDWYPGAAIAMARHGHLVASKTFGTARLGTADTAAVPVDDEYSMSPATTRMSVWMNALVSPYTAAWGCMCEGRAA
ncbi:hypothetical protein C2W62_34415 [Candidatus Entotheonella serta]|nr:hypothetical protein C2W62_34415 [Candidatus Entotheonella serta]